MDRLIASLAALTLLGAAPPLSEPEIAKLVDAQPDGPGCAVAIVTDGKMTFERGYGLADLETKRLVTADTAFNIASMTKQFTGLAVFLLIADGKLSEQDDLRKYLPELKDYGTPIRIANLLNHTSGLRNHMALAAFQPGDHLPSHQEALSLIFRQSALNFTPGTRHQYESPNYVLLAEIITRASGMPYEEFLQQRIFRPLGMSNTGFQQAALARAYAKLENGGWRLQEKVNRAKGSSGLLSTVADFSKWMANYDRLGVGGKAWRAKVLSTSQLADGTPITYRYGLAKEFDFGGMKGLTRLAHGGQTAAYRSAFSFVPGRGFGDVVMCNFAANAQAIDEAIVGSWANANLPPPPVVQKAAQPPLPAHASSWVGTYYSAADDDVRVFLVKDDQMHIRVFGQEFPITYRAGSTFEFEGQGTFEFVKAAMTERIAEQAVLRFKKMEAPPAQELSDFTGTYRSQDVDGLVTIAVKDGRLALTYPAGKAQLSPVGKDLFSAQAEDFNAVRFVRDPANGVTGLSLTVSSGITRLRFERMES